MYFTLSKLLPALIMPYMVLFWVLLVCLIFLIKNKLKWLRVLLVTTIVSLYVLSLPYFTSLHLSNELSKWNSYSLPNDSVDVAIVLGGFMSKDPLYNYQVESSFDRLLTGIRLIKDKKANYLLLSGGSAEEDTSIYKPEALLMKAFINEFYILPDSVLLIESQSKTTFENAKFSNRIISDLNLSKRVYLVTTYNHIERASQLFEQQGFTIIPVPIDIPFPKEWTQQFPFFLLPDINSLSYWSKVYREWLGSVWYSFSGRQ